MVLFLLALLAWACALAAWVTSRFFPQYRSEWTQATVWLAVVWLSLIGLMGVYNFQTGLWRF